MLVSVPDGVVARALIMAPIVLIAVAVMPAIFLLPLLPTGPSRRVLGVVMQLRTWHAEVVQAITTGPRMEAVDSGQIDQ